MAATSPTFRLVAQRGDVMEPSAQDWHLVELVVMTFGRKPAFGIRFDFRNPPTVGQYETAYQDSYVNIVPLNLPAEIPFLAPSQEWRIVWDSALDRRQLGERIESRFDGAVTYYDKPSAPGGPAKGKRQQGHPRGDQPDQRGHRRDPGAIPQSIRRNG